MKRVCKYCKYSKVIPAKEMHSAADVLFCMRYPPQFTGQRDENGSLGRSHIITEPDAYCWEYDSKESYTLKEIREIEGVEG